jgi:LysR family transcriptional regulator, glycine cleavage system transcriptional activator
VNATPTCSWTCTLRWRWWTCSATASTPRCASAWAPGAAWWPTGSSAAPQRATRLRHGDHTAIAAEPLLGNSDWWDRFLALCGCKLSGKTVADFNDGGLLLQAAEGDLGIALARELLAADALRAGRLVRVSPLALHTPIEGTSSTYWFVHPPELEDWAPLVALRQWLSDEMALAKAALAPPG